METKRYGHERRYRGHMHNVEGESEAYLYHFGRQFVRSVLRFFASFVLFCLSICFLLVYDTLLPSTGGWAYIFSGSLDV